MQLSSEQISQFQLLYKKRFGEEISREDAIEKGMKLVNLIELTYKPTNENELEKTNVYDQS